MATKNATTTAFRCETRSYKGSWGLHLCRKPASQVRVEYSAKGTPAESKTYYPICNFHASIENRRVYGGAKIEELTAEAADQIAARLDREAKVEEERRAVKRAEVQVQHEAAVKRAAEEQAAKWSHRRHDDEKSEWPNGFGEKAVTVMQPRWYVKSDADPRDWDQMEVKVTDHYGQQIIEVRNSSRLTPNAAKALIKALQAAIKEAEQD